MEACSHCDVDEDGVCGWCGSDVGYFSIPSRSKDHPADIVVSDLKLADDVRQRLYQTMEAIPIQGDQKHYVFYCLYMTYKYLGKPHPMQLIAKDLGLTIKKIPAPVMRLYA